VGTTYGITYKVYLGKKIVALGQPNAAMTANQSVVFKADFAPAKGKTYTVTTTVNDPHGNAQTVTAALVAS
jgi:hypothetical protein